MTSLVHVNARILSGDEGYALYVVEPDQAGL